MDVNSRSSRRRCSIKIDNLEILQNSLENTCVRVSFLIKLQALTCNFIKKEALAQVFFCEFYEIFKNTFFTEHLRATASLTLLFFATVSVLYPCLNRLAVIFDFLVKYSATRSPSTAEKLSPK